MNKRKLTFLMLCTLFAVSFTGCSSDDDDFADVDGLVPSISLETSHVRTEIGREFTIKGKVEDKDGIRSIRLQNADLNLDKTIDLIVLYDELQYDYNLSYKFKTPKDQTGDSFDVKLTVTDVGGRTTDANVLVTMDGDFTPPVFTASPDVAITVLMKEETKLNLRFTVEDDKALDYVEVAIPEIDFYQKVAAEGKVVNFNESIELPSEAATYNLTITAVDKFAWETVRKSVITVSEMPDFEKMYLADVKEAAQLNSDVFGIPMLIERTAPYTYRARYYSEEANTEIRFIPQKTDFTPICFGIDPDNSETLTDEPERSNPVILPLGKVYYEITFNTITGEYAFETYVPADEPVKIGEPMYLDASRPEEGTIPLEIGLVGAGLPGAGNWTPSEPYMLTQDKDNPYLLYGEITLEAGTEVEFIIHNKHSWGWWDYKFWRWNDSSEDPEWNVPQGGENSAKWKIKTSGKYMFKFDTHLLRSKFYPIN